MRDFRDAKAMAQTLRGSLATKSITISHSESLEFVSRLFGISDWNTLSALIRTELQETDPRRKTARYPAIPIRDFVPFPTMTFPLFVARQKTKHAIDQAFAQDREIVLIIQKDVTVEKPNRGDIYDVGVLARLLEIEQVADGSVFRGQPLPADAMKILVQAHRRVEICQFTGDKDVFYADIADLGEVPISDAPEQVRNAVDRFKSYATAHRIRLPQTLDQMRDPGRLADIISQNTALPVSEKQSLLATLDPLVRLERVVALMDANP